MVHSLSGSEYVGIRTNEIAKFIHVRFAYISGFLFQESQSLLRKGLELGLREILNFDARVYGRSLGKGFGLVQML